MKYIKQRNKTDCGVACVAMLANVTYTQAKLALFGERHKGVGYTQTNQMRDTLEKLGVILSDRLVRCVHP